MKIKSLTWYGDIGRCGGFYYSVKKQDGPEGSWGYTEQRNPGLVISFKGGRLFETREDAVKGAEISFRNKILQALEDDHIDPDAA
jgi:hypothetical protein